MSDEVKNRLLSVLLGVGCSLVMSLAVILSLNASGYSFNLMFVLGLVLAAVLPLCIRLPKDSELDLKTARLVTVVSSFLIVLLYAYTVQQNWDSFMTIAKYSALMHALALTVVCLFH